MNSGSPRLNFYDGLRLVCDWMAMGYYFGDTAEEYYYKNEHEIKLPEWAVDLIKEIFERIRD